jgi:hypothetical protein
MTVKRLIQLDKKKQTKVSPRGRDSSKSRIVTMAEVFPYLMKKIDLYLQLIKLQLEITLLRPSLISGS